MKMMQRLVVGAALCAVISTIAVLTQCVFFQSPKVAYVDTQRLLREYKGMQAARAEYEKKATLWKANADTLTQELTRKVVHYERQRGMMSTKERQLTEELIRSRQTQLVSYQEALRTQAQQEDARMTEQVLTTVNAHIKKFSEARGYTIIFASTAYGNIAFAQEALDITDAVIESLNDEYTN